MKNIRQLAILLFALLLGFLSFGQEEQKIQVGSLPSLPAANKVEKALGYAGMFGGIHNNTLIVAGGANFPNGLPWKGGDKVWSNVIYVLKDKSWTIANAELSNPLAYGSSVTIDEGILCIGGENKKETSAAVFLLNYSVTSNTITTVSYPPLPEPLAYTAAVVADNYVYVVGGKNATKSTNAFYRLDLKEKKKWEKLPSFPGAARALHSIAIQETKTSKELFVIGGRNQVAGKKSIVHSNYLSYNFLSKKWKDKGPLKINGRQIKLMGAAAETKGAMHVLVYGGCDEVVFNKIEHTALAIKAAINDSIRTVLKDKLAVILDTHPGFSKEVLAYNTITDKWFVYDTLAVKIPVTALSYKSKDVFVIVSGEISPGIRTPKVAKFTVDESANTFGFINYTVLVLYLLISLAIGIYFARKQKSTNDYFSGGGRIPWWAAGLSVFGTLLSAITFMAIPAKAFVTDWSYFLLNIMAILITPIIAFVFIPFFNKLNITTAYEFLENRFNYLTRALGSFSFMLFQLGRIGIVLLLPSLAISIVTGIPVEYSILVMGILCILYTTFGGIEAVIWTDVLQVIVLMGGSILAIVWIMIHTETSFTDMITYASDREKFNIINLDFNFTDTTLWVLVLGGLASAMVTQGTDQTIVQRYLTSSNLKDSQKTLYTNAILTLPATIIFFGLGTLLFMFYTEMPEKLSPSIANNDSIFPWYIVRELPVGVSGLLVAGIFSAAMSSISSSLNSVATAFCADFYKHYKPEVADKKLLKVARLATIIIGVVGIVFALWMANSNIKSLWDQFYKFLGLFTGGLGGMFLLGMLTKVANAKGTLIGLFISAVLIWYVSMYTNISFLLYAFLGVVSCFVFGYICSLIFKEHK